MEVILFLRALWRWRFTILLALTLGVGGWVLWRMDQLKDDAAEARADLAEAVRINGDMAKAMDQLEAAREFSERALADRLARKSKEADRLGRLVQHVMAQERTNACAASPAIRSVLDGLRNPGGPAQ
jgi:uncharacterized protein HemX